MSRKRAAIPEHFSSAEEAGAFCDTHSASGHQPVDFSVLGIAISLVVFIIGIVYLKHSEKYFVDLV
jgi:hypothetical protein